MYNKLGFNRYQVAEREKGEKLSLDCSVFWYKHFDSFQMHQILEGMYRGLNIEVYAKPEFDAGQMREIRLGMESGINYEIYAKPDIEEYKMFQLREKEETELSKMRYLGRTHIFDTDPLRMRQKYKEFAALVNLDMSQYKDYENSKLRAVLPLIYGGKHTLALEFLNSAKPASQIEHEVSKFTVSGILPAANKINEESLKNIYPVGYDFVKKYKQDDLDSNDMKVAFIVNQFSSVSDNIEVLEAIMVAGLCNYDLDYVTREGFDPRFTKLVLDLIDLEKDYDFIYSDEYSFNQKLELYRVAINDLDVSRFIPDMSLGEMIQLRKDLQSKEK